MDKKLIILVILFNFCFVGHCQTKTNIDSNTFDKKLLKSDKYLMDCFIEEENPKTKFATFNVEIEVTDKTITVNTASKYDRSNETIKDKTITDIKSLKPIYRSTFSKTYNYEFNFDCKIKGYYLDKNNEKKTTLNYIIAPQTIDNFLYIYLLGSLPLSESIKGSLSTYDYNIPNKNKTADVLIKEVKSTNLPNDAFKENGVWELAVLETAVNDNYHFFIDKNTQNSGLVKLGS